MAGSDNFNVRRTGGQPPQVNVQSDIVNENPQPKILTLGTGSHLLKTLEPIDINHRLVHGGLTLQKMDSITESDRQPSITKSDGQPSIDSSSDDLDVQNQNKPDALKPFRDRKLKATTAKGAIFGTVVGGIGGTFAAIKLAAIGAAIGTMVMPGIGTAVGAVIGGVIGFVAPTAFGIGVFGRVGHLAGKSEAKAISVESLMREYGPKSMNFDLMLMEAGIVDGDTISETDSKGIEDGLRQAMQDRVDSGRPFGRDFIETVELALWRINSRPDLSRDAKTNLGVDFLQPLKIPNRSHPSMAEATVDALIDVYANRNLEANEARKISVRFVNQLTSLANDGQSVSPDETRGIAEQYLNEALSAKNDNID